MNFKWNPTSFQEVVRVTHTREGQVYAAIITVLRQVGSLSCPAPGWDQHGTYRVAIENGVPKIQKFGTDSTWHSASLHAPGESQSGA